MKVDDLQGSSCHWVGYSEATCGQPSQQNVHMYCLSMEKAHPDDPWGSQHFIFCYGPGTLSSVQFSHSSHVQFFATPWTAECQDSLFIINSYSLLKLMSTEFVMPSNHLILCCSLFLPPSIFPSIRVFSNESALCIGGQNIGVSASTSVLPTNIQDWFPLGWTGWISLQSKGFSRVLSNTTVQKHQFFGAQLCSPTLTSIHDYWTNHSLD